MEVIIHCSDSSWGNSIVINEWHLQNGWSGIGYHAVILNGKITAKCYNKHFNGAIESGRPFDDNDRIEGWETGAHVKSMNDRIGVCLIGKSGKFTAEQIASLTRFLGWMKEQFHDIIISQHSDHDPKKPYCAGLSKEYIKQLNYLMCCIL